ncbi:hypothetical protein D9V32_03045 [Mycetocola tolaasinivorans]|uniref:Acyltransferase 3 domain-containing protein n=1 Tax=Mycetocola tolaasinivorans TaxID=76635 RepID=A0A3L7AAN0_9MICO|nr:hypothetical protein [Mycetocola tolaasinivorans]RLP77439.1 hypothetical protein D9V32_03045 [Mycetocola tolaasinivorans]
MHRVVSSVYLVIVWTTLYFVIRLLIGQPLPGAAVDVSQYIRNLYTPNSVLWFVYVLGAWNFLVILLRRAPRWVGFSVFAVALPLLLEAGIGLPNRIIIYGTFFAAGVYFKDWFLAFFTDRVGLKAVLLPVFAVAAGFLAVATESIPVLSFYTWTLQHFLAAMATIALVSIACRWSLFARVFGWLGQRTLQMFILHQPVAWLVMTIPVLQTILMADVIRWIWPVTGMIFLAAVSLGAYALLSRTPLKYLFRLPKFPPAKSVAVPVPAREQSSIA